MSNDRQRVLPPLLAGLAGAVAFLVLHAGDHWRFMREIHARTAAHGYPWRGAGLTADTLAFAAAALATYAGYALISAAIAAKTRDRFLWVLPPLVEVAWPLVGGLIGRTAPIQPQVLGGYHVEPVGAMAWLAALADLLLVLAPGAVIALRSRGPRRRVDGSDRRAFFVCASLAAFVYLLRQYGASESFDVNSSAHMPLVLLFVAGVALGGRRPFFPWVHLALAYLFSEAVAIVAWWIAPFPGSSSPSAARMLADILRSGLPGLAAVGFGALTHPLAAYLRRRRGPRVAEGVA